MEGRVIHRHRLHEERVESASGHGRRGKGDGDATNRLIQSVLSSLLDLFSHRCEAGQTGELTFEIDDARLEEALQRKEKRRT